MFGQDDAVNDEKRFAIAEEDDDSTEEMTPIRNGANYPVYSTKVFIGGLPYDIDPAIITSFFNRFGTNFVDWPHRGCCNRDGPVNGYAFVIFSHECSVQSLVNASEISKGKLLIDLKDGDRVIKTVQVKPWNLDRSTCSLISLPEFIDRYSIFVAGIPRTLTAMELVQLFQQVVNNVVQATLEVESSTNYPRGSAKVVFGNREAFLVAIAMHRFTLCTLSEQRVVEMRPYVLEGMSCEICYRSAGVFLCPQLPCLLYYCVQCWTVIHRESGMHTHRPVTRRSMRLMNGPRHCQVPRQGVNFMRRGYYYFQQPPSPSDPDRQLFFGGFIDGFPI